MKYVNEFREKTLVQKWSDEIKKITTSPWTLMEICGGQTHAIVKYTLEELLPKEIRLIHGPGCPVCVTPLSAIDHAIYVARQPGVLLCTYADILRVPGTDSSLLHEKAKGAHIVTVSSPLEILSIAEHNKQHQIVFVAIGFETTAAPHALAILEAKRRKLDNLSLLVSHVLVPPAITALLEDTSNQIDGFLAAGHVCSITGYHDYLPICQRYQKPIVITGFEPVDILQGIYYCVQQLEKKSCYTENQYHRVVDINGNQQALNAMQEVFTVVDKEWRGLGWIRNSGLAIGPNFSYYDAAVRFFYNSRAARENSGCISGEILQGKKTPLQCPHFKKNCTPTHPKGAPMVSSEGACAAYYYHKDMTPNA